MYYAPVSGQLCRLKGFSTDSAVANRRYDSLTGGTSDVCRRGLQPHNRHEQCRGGQ
ncbi:MAG: hypothetical protein GFH24_608298n54 [Chloroflexi bacterium AL-N5]|nr:hypothetical protein [Chloroflexi bacterium AL-N5]